MEVGQCMEVGPWSVALGTKADCDHNMVDVKFFTYFPHLRGFGGN